MRKILCEKLTVALFTLTVPIINVSQSVLVKRELRVFFFSQIAMDFVVLA